MSHAPKRISAIPTETVVQIYAWEGLLFDTTQKLAECLKAIFEGDETLWSDLDKLRQQTIFYNKQYTLSILNMQRSQNKG